NEYLPGWATYFRWATRDRPFRHLDAWIRRRLRCVRLKQRKRSYSIARFLQSLGVRRRQAWLLARSGKGWWRKSGSPQASEAMTNQWFRNHGILSLTDKIAALRHSQEPPDTRVRPVVWEDGGREAPSYPICALPPAALT